MWLYMEPYIWNPIVAHTVFFEDYKNFHTCTQFYFFLKSLKLIKSDLLKDTGNKNYHNKLS